MREFVVRNDKEKEVATFQEFQDAWDYLVIALQNEGDIIQSDDNNESNS